MYAQSSSTYNHIIPLTLPILGWEEPHPFYFGHLVRGGGSLELPLEVRAQD